MTTEPKHTPTLEHSKLPWIVTENGANGYITVEAADGAVVHTEDLGCIPEEMPSGSAERLREELVGNAYLMTRACNLFAAHEAVAEVAKEARQWLARSELPRNVEMALKLAKQLAALEAVNGGAK